PTQNTVDIVRRVQLEITYAYTKRWQVDSLHYPPANIHVGYRYNARKFLDSMVAKKGTTPVFRQVLEYDDDGQITRQKYEHGTSGEKHQEYVYDEARRLRSFWYDYGSTGTQYTYDKVGNRMAAEKYDNGSALWSDLYSYMDATGPNRLTRRIRLYPNSTRDTTFYSYNKSGALVYESKNGVSESFAYDNIGGLVKKYARVTGGGMFGTLQEWHYRYSASGEREQKRQYVSI